MDYFISRDGQQYGPYTLADLQRYVASGEISLTDLATSDALTQPVPVAQIIGNIAVTQAPTSGGPISMMAEFPDPPNLHRAWYSSSIAYPADSSAWCGTSFKLDG